MSKGYIVNRKKAKSGKKNDIHALYKETRKMNKGKDIDLMQFLKDSGAFGQK